jgi:hypothetical protein
MFMGVTNLFVDKHCFGYVKNMISKLAFDCCKISFAGRARAPFHFAKNQFSKKQSVGTA